MATGRESIDNTDPAAWRTRAKDSWRAANVLALDQKPPMVMSATSRLYYSVYQGAVAFMLETRPSDTLPANHGKFWNYLFGLKSTRHTELGTFLQTMFSWRCKADYAEDDVSEANVRQLLARCKPVLTQIRVCEDS